MQYKSLFASSSDSTGQTLSKTIDGLITILSAILPMIALRYFHITLTATDVASFFSEGATIIGSIMAIRGLFHKVVNTVGTIKS